MGFMDDVGYTCQASIRHRHRLSNQALMRLDLSGQRDPQHCCEAHTTWSAQDWVKSIHIVSKARCPLQWKATLRTALEWLFLDSPCVPLRFPVCHWSLLHLRITMFPSVFFPYSAAASLNCAKFKDMIQTGIRGPVPDRRVHTWWCLLLRKLLIFRAVKYLLHLIPFYSPLSYNKPSMSTQESAVSTTK